MIPAIFKRMLGQNRQDSWSLRATWRAMRYLPGDTFPQFLPRVHIFAAPFILWRLKRTGYSNCRVVSHNGGLLVYADR